MRIENGVKMIRSVCVHQAETDNMEVKKGADEAPFVAGSR
jgi:hypothetical protein